VPISAEGKAAACAHLSHVGNIAAAVADLWSNESVQNVRLLSTFAPTVCLEQLVYDCRLMNVALAQSAEDARRLQGWLVASDAGLDPQAWVLRPDVVLRIAADIVAEETPYLRTRRAVLSAVAELRRANLAGEVRIPPREVPWLDRLQTQADALPQDEGEFRAGVERSIPSGAVTPEEYGLKW